jgi:hypothetical protein
MPNMNTGKPFTPLCGKCYDLRFDKINRDGQGAYCPVRIRVNGLSPLQWENTDTGKPLDPRFSSYRVHAYKEITMP